MKDPHTHRRATASRRSREREERREEILRAARKIAAVEGIDKMTVRDVAYAASVSVGAVYLHFGSRDDLLAHLVIDGLRRAQNTWEERYERRRPRGLRVLAETYVEALLAHSDLFEATVRLRLDLKRANLSARAASDLRDAIGSVIRPFERTIGSRAPHLTQPRRIALSLWSALHGIVLTFARQPGRDVVEERTFLHEQAGLLADSFEALLGLKPRKRVPRRSVEPR